MAQSHRVEVYRSGFSAPPHAIMSISPTGGPMFYRMTRLHFAEDGFDDLVELATSLRDRVEGIAGLRFADLIRTGEGEGMIISSYQDAIAFEASAQAETDVLDLLAALLTSTPHGHEGSVILSFHGSTG